MSSMTETEKVEAYRVEMFEDQMGFTHRDAELLAASGADLHKVADMVAAGCSHELALIISL